MGDDFEFERDADRDEAVALFSGIADGVAAGSIELADGDRSVTAAVADDLELSVEFEDEDGDLELEVELEWEDPGEPPADRREAVDPPDPAEDEPPDPAEGEGLDSAEDEGPDATAEGTPDRSREATEGGDVPGSDPGDAAAEPASGDRAPDPGDTTPAETERVGPGDPAGSLGRFELFTDRGGKWRWRLVHRNGNVVATSGQGYTRKHNAIKGLRSVQGNAPGATVVVETDD